jgi:hypothetical protein
VEPGHKQAIKSREPWNTRQLLKAASTVFATVTQADCQDFLSHAGYATCLMGIF